MTNPPNRDPLEGFHFDDFDPEAKQLTIRIHEYIIRHPKSKEALLNKLSEVLSYGDQIDSIVVKPRD